MKRPKVRSNEATILTVLGGIGMIATAVLTAKETPKAIKLMEEAKEEKGEALTPAEIAITIAPAYVPAIAVGVSSLLCIFGANVLNKKAQASLMSAYSMAGNMYRDYRKKNIEMFGEENDKAIIEDLQRYRCDYHQIGINTPDAKVRWYEPISCTFFEAYEREVMDAEYHFNRNYILRGEAHVNELLEFLGIEQIDDGDIYGWCIQDEMYWVDFEHHVKEDSKGSYYVIDTIFPAENLCEYNYW
jgi:hypothetical protein